MLRTKALVIGGGPAGATAARFLAEAGTDTILVERNFSFIKPCGGGLPSTVFDELRIPKSAIKKEIRKIRLVSPKGEVLNIGIKGGSIAMVQRGEFDSLLRGEAVNSGAHLMEAELKSIEKTGKQIIAKLNIAGKEEYIKTDYLIAADGVNSRVRLALGLKLPSSLYTISEKMRGVVSDSCEFWFGTSHAPKSYSWVFPKAEGVSAGTGGFVPDKLKGCLKKFYQRRGFDSTNSTKMYRIPLWNGELYNKNNIFFAGDAAGHVMPLTYEGMYHAMRAGEFAARAVIAGKPSDYKKLWKERFNARFLIMKKLCEYFLRDDDSAEKLVAIFRRNEIQDLCMRLWLEKSSDRKPLVSFVNFFRKTLT